VSLCFSWAPVWKLWRDKWTYSLLTITRRIGPSEAGVWVASFWISLTAFRFAIGAIANGVRSDRLLQFGIGFAGAGGIFLSLDRGMVTALAALVVLGLGLAPLFPLLISTTTGRVGARHAANGAGFQVSGAHLGAALLPTLVGAMGNTYGLNVVGPFLVVAALCLYLLHQIVLFFGRQYASTLKLGFCRADSRDFPSVKTRAGFVTARDASCSGSPAPERNTGCA
jgi:hypothetical protein